MAFGSTSLPPPTGAELERWEAIKDRRRCSACRCLESVEIHHLLSPGGLRLGHSYTAALCRTCHRFVKARSFKKHHPDQILLDRTNEDIGWPAVELPAARPRRRNTRPSKIFKGFSK